LISFFRTSVKRTFGTFEFQSESPVCAYSAGDQRGLVYALLLDQQFERLEPPSAGGDRIHSSLGATLFKHWPHGDGAEQRPLRVVLDQFLDQHACLDVAHVRLAEHQLVEGDVARGTEGYLLLLGHLDVSATGQPGASLPTSKPATENPAHLSLSI